MKEVWDEIVAKDTRYSNCALMLSCECGYYYVSGEVKTPGPKPYVKGLTISRAIQAAGGFTKLANTNKVQLVRANGKKISVKLYDAHPDPSVFSGDSVVVSRRLVAR